MRRHRESESAIQTAAWRQGQRPRTRKGSSRLSHRGSDALPRRASSVAAVDAAPSSPRSAVPAAPAVLIVRRALGPVSTGWPLFPLLVFIIRVAPSFPRSATPSASVAAPATPAVSVASVAPSFPRSATPAASSAPVALTVIASNELAHQECSANPTLNDGLVEVTGVVGISIKLRHNLFPHSCIFLFIVHLFIAQSSLILRADTPSLV